MSYNWQRDNWPLFNYERSGLEDTFLSFSERTGHISGLAKGLSAKVQTEDAIDLMATEALATSAIEGELFSRRDVLSSIRRSLGYTEDAPTGGGRYTHYQISL